jgi:putative Mg2+ transporter-C (MgtC) family protein
MHMTLQQEFEAALLIALAGLLSAIVGIDRESHAPAGLRTHMLVGMGSCLFTLLSIHAFPGGDPARIAAQVVTGIGFLGAGTIMQRKGDVHFLTTAASIWATAAVGMAVGAGEWFLGMTSTLLIWVVLKIIRLFQPDKSNEEENPS